MNQADRDTELFLQIATEIIRHGRKISHRGRRAKFPRRFHILRWRIRGTDRVLNRIDRVLGNRPKLGRLSYYLRVTVRR